MTVAQYGYHKNVVLKFGMRDLRVYPLSRITSSKCPDFENALIKIIDAGILLLREYTEEDFAEMDAKQAEANRNAQKLACKISSYNDLMVAMNMEGLGTLYKKYWR